MLLILFHSLFYEFQLQICNFLVFVFILMFLSFFNVVHFNCVYAGENQQIRFNPLFYGSTTSTLTSLVYMNIFWLSYFTGVPLQPLLTPKITHFINCFNPYFTGSSNSTYEPQMVVSYLSCFNPYLLEVHFNYFLFYYIVL
jgi:hypothetical protein